MKFSAMILQTGVIASLLLHSGEARLGNKNDDSNKARALDSTSPQDCATALQSYRDSSGETYTQVQMACLQSPTCAAAAPIWIPNQGAAPMHIACNFTETTAQTEFSDCETQESEVSSALGNLVDFPVRNDAIGPDVALLKLYNMENTNYHNDMGIEWGITKGCNSDNHVYLLYKNREDGGEEGLYTVVGYQTLETFVNGEFVHGKGFVEGEGVSGIAPGSDCPFGHEKSLELLGSCQLVEEESEESEESGNSKLLKSPDRLRLESGDVKAPKTKVAAANSAGDEQGAAIQAANMANPQDCAAALQTYRESSGEAYTQVQLECVRSCAAPSRLVDAVAMQKDTSAIVCSFTEQTIHSEWSNCETTSTQEEKDLGSLTFTATVNDWMTGFPMIKNVPGYDSTESMEWGVTMGCGNDEHVYLLYRNSNDEGEDALYTVVGYQTLEAFLQERELVDGKAGIRGEGVSGIAPGSDCPVGRDDTTDLLGSCQFMG
ncbi:expressed unknown protein [Seminavis robusta]|uniref:Uncharacterized protein n=1 Tax=Seminavis robusta TaxID=568900 RepID=A0A9N8DJ60_9STRA|nr:expressed unknown protein [Seminavis robusta]|eukprot:Sro170_g075470.1 n/a (490) ;mRNA; f:59295-60764